MTIHVRYLSQVIVRMNFEDSLDEQMKEELERCVKEQVDNAKKQLFYLIDLNNYQDKKELESLGEAISEELAKHGNVIGEVAILSNKKFKIKQKEVSKKVKFFSEDFKAQSHLSDASRFGFLDEISLKSLQDR